jgi:hypothetical protein
LNQERRGDSSSFKKRTNSMQYTDFLSMRGSLNASYKKKKDFYIIEGNKKILE